MQFANPLFLFALVAVAIPIVIHLFNFRRYKRVYFTNVHFLSEIQQETKKRSQLKQLLILLARILAVISLVLAFAQPFFPSEKQVINKPGRRAVTIYIDNSGSMEAVGTEGKLLDIAKTRAAEIVAAYSPSDLFQLITNDFKGIHQRFVTRDDSRKSIEEVTLSPALRPISAVISRQNEVISAEHNLQHDAFLISDFQKTTTDFSIAKPDTGINWFIVPVSAGKRDNLYIDSIWFDSPVHQPLQMTRLMVRVRNLGPSIENAPIKLTINNVQKALASYNIDAGSFTDVALNYTENMAGQQYGTVKITDYPIVNDDDYFFAYQILPSIPILCISDEDENRYLNALYSGDSIFSYRNSSGTNIDYSTFNRFPLIILNSLPTITSGLTEELVRYVNEGGNLVVFPPQSGDITSFNNLLKQLHCGLFGQVDTNRQRVATINLENELFADVFEKGSMKKNALPDNTDLPVVFRHYLSSQPDSGYAEPLVKLQNDADFLRITHLGKGKVYLFAAPLNLKWSNFAQHIIFVPVMYRIALLSNIMQPLSYMAGGDAVIELPFDTITNNELYKIARNDNKSEVIPENRLTRSGISLLTHGQITEAGFYIVKGRPGVERGIAFNYNRLESDLACYSSSDLNNEIKKAPFHHVRILKEKESNLTLQLNQLNQGTPLWKFFIISALLFLALEIIFIRLIKK